MQPVRPKKFYKRIGMILVAYTDSKETIWLTYKEERADRVYFCKHYPYMAWKDSKTMLQE